MKKVIVKYYGANNSILTDEYEDATMRGIENILEIKKGSTVLAIYTLNNIIGAYFK